MRLGDASAVSEQAQHELRYDFSGEEMEKVHWSMCFGAWNWAVPFHWSQHDLFHLPKGQWDLMPVHDNKSQAIRVKRYFVC